MLFNPRLVEIGAEHECWLVKHSTRDEVDADTQLFGFESQGMSWKGPRRIQQDVEAPWVERGPGHTGICVGVGPHPIGEQALTGLDTAPDHGRHITSLARA